MVKHWITEIRVTDQDRHGLIAYRKGKYYSNYFNEFFILYLRCYNGIIRLLTWTFSLRFLLTGTNFFEQQVKKAWDDLIETARIWKLTTFWQSLHNFSLNLKQKKVEKVESQKTTARQIDETKETFEQISQILLQTDKRKIVKFFVGFYEGKGRTWLFVRIFLQTTLISASHS